MDLIERIGPGLGLVAFLGLAVLVFLIFQQAREVRRLREWAGAAPERARQAAEASLAAAEARSEVAPRRPAEQRERHSLWSRIKSGTPGVWRTAANGSPVPPHYLLIALGFLLIVGGLVGGSLGLFGGDDGDGGGGHDRVRRGEIEVAVLNATQIEGETQIAGVPQLATTVADKVVEPAGYQVGKTDDSPAPSDETLILYARGELDAAHRLARDIRRELGKSPVQELTDDVRQVVGEADLTVVVGQDNSEFQ